jgi:cellulose synthase/poly-beta-1,6-N-acetylglucosamine synthase-like glycosyltransferase
LQRTDTYRYYRLCEPTLCIVTYNFIYQIINNSLHIVFLFFQNGHILHAATQNIRYTVELITKYLTVFHFSIYISNHKLSKLSTLHLYIGAHNSLISIHIHPLQCASLNMADICRRAKKLHLLVTSPHHGLFNI